MSAPYPMPPQQSMQPMQQPQQMWQPPQQQPQMWPPQQAQQRPAAFKITPQIIALIAVGAVCLAIFIVGLYLFFTTKF